MVTDLSGKAKRRKKPKKRVARKRRKKAVKRRPVRRVSRVPLVAPRVQAAAQARQEIAPMMPEESYPEAEELPAPIVPSEESESVTEAPYQDANLYPIAPIPAEAQELPQEAPPEESEYTPSPEAESESEEESEAQMGTVRSAAKTAVRAAVYPIKAVVSAVTEPTGTALHKAGTGIGIGLAPIAVLGILAAGVYLYSKRGK